MADDTNLASGSLGELIFNKEYDEKGQRIVQQRLLSQASKLRAIALGGRRPRYTQSRIFQNMSAKG